MSAQPYAFDARANTALASPKKKLGKTPTGFGMYALHVPEINATIYKPIDYRPSALEPLAWQHDECLAAVNAAIDAAEKQAAIDVKAFRKRHGVFKKLTVGERIRAERRRMSGMFAGH